MFTFNDFAMMFSRKNLEKSLVNSSFRQRLLYSTDQKELKLLIEKLGEYKVVWLQLSPGMYTMLKNYLMKNKFYLARVYKNIKIVSKKSITYKDRLELLSELAENNYKDIKWSRISDYLKIDKIYFREEEFNELKLLLEDFSKKTKTKLILEQKSSDLFSIYDQ